MADLRIVDAPLIPKVDITGSEKIPTGGSGNYSISLDGIAEYTQESLYLAYKTDVQTSENGVKALIKQHTDNLSNPHVVTKDQVGLGNVDNTADADKPMSNLTQSVITTLDQKKADKTSVYLKTETYNKNEVDSALANKPNSNVVYTKTETNNLLNGKISSVNGKTGTAITLTRNDLGISSDEVMQQWQKEARFVTDESGLTQQQVNDKTARIVASVAELIAIQNPKDGQAFYVKSYHDGLNKGGSDFIVIQSNSLIENLITCFRSKVVGYENFYFVRTGVNTLTVDLAGAKGDGVSDDTEAFQRAFDLGGEIHIPKGIYLCNALLRKSFNVIGSGKETVLQPFDITKPVLTNINKQSLSWSNDTLSNLEIRSTNQTGVGFSYGVLPAVEDYLSVGRVIMNNVKFNGLEKGIQKVNGNIGNKYYSCDFEFCKYGVYAKGHQLSVPSSTDIMHAGCDHYYSCNFSENRVAGCAYYDSTGGSGQWLFNNCLFQFNYGFGTFFDFNLTSNLFSPIVFANSWFESNGGNQVEIDRIDGSKQILLSTNRRIIGTNDVIIWGGEDFNTRMGIGMSSPQRTLHIHEKVAPVIQLTNDVTGSLDGNRGGLIYFSYPDLYLENKEVGKLYLSTSTGKVEIDSLGNLVSRKGKIGYGKGAGNSVTQTGNKDSSVMINQPSGRIKTSDQSIATGAIATFVLNNSLITDSDVIVTNVRFSPSNSGRYYSVNVTNIENGSCQINIKNNQDIALAESIEISFVVISGSTDPNY